MFFFPRICHWRMSYRAVYCEQVWQCLCPAGARGSPCGKVAEWNQSWKRSRSQPQLPPCGTPPCPLPGGPPAASGWWRQKRVTDLGITYWRMPVSQSISNLYQEQVYSKYHQVKIERGNVRKAIFLSGESCGSYSVVMSKDHTSNKNDTCRYIYMLFKAVKLTITLSYYQPISYLGCTFPVNVNLMDCSKRYITRVCSCL